MGTVVMEDIGLDGLSEDQLVELGKAILREMARRDPLVQETMLNAILSERDRLLTLRDGSHLAAAAERHRQRDAIRAAQAEIAAVNSAEERLRHEVKALGIRRDVQRRRWQPAMTAAVMAEIIGLGRGFTVRKCTKGDTRVYLDSSLRSLAYYAEGNEQQPPGSLRAKSLPGLNRRAAQVLCDYIVKSVPQPAFAFADVLATGVEPLPLPPEFTEALS